MYFQKSRRKSEKILEEIRKILKTWKKFRKPGENFQKTFGHPEGDNLSVMHVLWYITFSPTFD